MGLAIAPPAAIMLGLDPRSAHNLPSLDVESADKLGNPGQAATLRSQLDLNHWRPFTQLPYF
jgi:hypothetical protein